MVDSRSTPEEPPADESGDHGRDSADSGRGETDSTSDSGHNSENDRAREEELRRAVQEKYDFDDFGPADMAEMTLEEWEAAFDPDTWITGPELLDRVEADLASRIAEREVFARVERFEAGDGAGERLIAYSDEGYATVYADGRVEGRGTVVRDVKPTVALCSMDSYEVPEPPDDEALPQPAEVPEGSGEFGNLMIQIVAGVQVLAGLALFAAWFAVGLSIVAAFAALGFVAIGVFLFVLVANARLSDKFRAEEYRNRLRAVGVESGERPDFVPVDGPESADGEQPEPVSADEQA